MKSTAGEISLEEFMEKRCVLQQKQEVI